MRNNLPNLKGILLLSLLLGVSIVSLKIIVTLKNKEVALQNYSTYLTRIPTNIPTDVLDKIREREKQLRITIEDFEKEQNMYNPTPAITPTPTISPTPTQTQQ